MAMAQHLPLLHPHLLSQRTRRGPVRVPPVISALKHLGFMLWHKGASVRARLHAGQRGGQLVPGRPLGKGH